MNCYSLVPAICSFTLLHCLGCLNNNNNDEDDNQNINNDSNTITVKCNKIVVDKIKQ